MTKLNELINELCPDGVEYYSFQIFFDEIKGMGGVSNKWAEKGNCRFIDYLNAYKNLSIDVNNLPYATVKNSNQDTLKKGDILFTSASEVPDECAIASAIENDIEEGIFLDDHLFGLRPKIEFSSKIITGYLKHYFHTIEYRKAVLKAVRGVTRFYISKPDFMKIVFPVPPLPVQEEIVRILDKFTSLEAELEAELEARRVQYEYYRDELLKPKLEIPVVKLKDIATDFYRGSGIKRDEITAEGVPCVRYGEIYTTYNISFDKCVSHTKLEYVQSPKYFEHGDILFAITGENIEDIAKSVAYTGNEKCLAGGDIVVMKHNQNPRYLAHVLATTEARIQKGKGKVKSKVVHSSIPSIQEIEIPLPPLDVQERWANVLDNFDAICSDLKIGLPAEIEARKKQYEYYRDLLLTFAERGNTILTEQNRTEQNRTEQMR